MNIWFFLILLFAFDYYIVWFVNCEEEGINPKKGRNERTSQFINDLVTKRFSSQRKTPPFMVFQHDGHHSTIGHHSHLELLHRFGFNAIQHRKTLTLIWPPLHSGDLKLEHIWGFGGILLEPCLSITLHHRPSISSFWWWWVSFHVLVQKYYKYSTQKKKQFQFFSSHRLAASEASTLTW